MVAKGEMEWERDKLGVWDQEIHTTIYKIDKQQDPIQSITQGIIFSIR